MADGVPRWKPSKYDRPAKGESHLGEGLPLGKTRRVRDPGALTQYKRQHPRCEGCGKAKTDDAHHIRSKAMGGDDDPETNIIALCRRCHMAWTNVNRTRAEWLDARKATMTPEARAKVLLALGPKWEA